MGRNRNLKEGFLMNSKIREVLRLCEEGFSQREIHRHLEVSRWCIQGYLSQAKACGITYELAKDLSDDQLRDRLGVIRPGRERVSCEDPDFKRDSPERDSPGRDSPGHPTFCQNRWVS